MSETQPTRRRLHDRIPVHMEIVDDTDSDRLTLSELKELKRLANLSRTARLITALMIGAITMIGLPEIISFAKAHWK